MEFYQGKRVLIAGGTGIIGRALAGLLVDAGARIKVASLDAPVDLNPGVEFVKLDL